MSGIRTKEVNELLCVLASMNDEDEIFALLEDLFTTREIKDTSQRLEVAQLLSRGNSYNLIEEKTGASATTIARVSKCLNSGSGGYAKALEILENECSR
ncbi:MAG: YerC/YecD family TrpR-related protein [Eggerthellaceae bacterium]|nr:YerC/YecD family TrpR-related protein [Eggerthellaceae bacterium]